MSRFNRDWRYHKEERVWITRAPGMEPTLKTNTYERGTYYFFDCLNWRKVAKVHTHTQLLCTCGTKTDELQNELTFIDSYFDQENIQILRSVCVK